MDLLELARDAWAAVVAEVVANPHLVLAAAVVGAVAIALTLALDSRP